MKNSGRRCDHTSTFSWDKDHAKQAVSQIGLSLRELARENFDANDEIKRRYGTFAAMERHLQLPDQLACSIDLATATGTSYVLYGIST